MTNPTPRSTQYEDRLRRLDEEWEASLADVALPVHVVSTEFAFRFLEGEVALHWLRNKRLRTLLSRHLAGKDEWKLREPPSLYAIQVILAKSVLEGYNEQIASLVAAGLKILDRGDYVQSLVARIEAKISSSEPISDELSFLVRELVIAFILRGFEVRDLRNLMHNIFFDNISTHDGLLHSTFPYAVLKPVLPTSDLSTEQGREQYNAALSLAVDSLTPTSRFGGITTFFQQMREELTYIFAINGIKGTRGRVIGEIEIYPPHTAPKGQGGELGETFARNEPNCLNAAITFQSLGNEEDRSRAARRIQESLDLIDLYVPARVPSEIDTTSCIILRADGAWAGSAAHRRRLDPAIEHRHMARDLDEIAARQHPALQQVTDVASRLRNHRIGGQSETRIEEALHAISKANENDVLEDRLVNYWIAIEALMGRSADKESIAAEVIPAMVVSSSRWNIGWELLAYLRHIHANREHPRFRVALEGISDDLLRRSDVVAEPWSHVDLRNCIGTLDEWLAIVPIETDVNRRIALAKAFYSNRATAKKELHRLWQIASDDVVLIYQVRNRIVHHAFLDSPGMPYLVERASHFANLFMNASLTQVGVAPARIIADEVTRAKQILYRIEHDQTFDILGDEPA